MPKLFPRTADGDQLSLNFEYQEELDAFRGGISLLTNMAFALRQKKSTDQYNFRKMDFPEKRNIIELKKGVNLLSTLQVEALRAHSMAVPKILGVNSCNVFGRDSVHMSNWSEK
jgi:hypothetical protein